MGLKIVAALGGNALGNTPKEQIKKIKSAACHIADMIYSGYEVVLTHGNGPQVGMINLAFSESTKINEKLPLMNLPECTAMSQGYIGYHLQNGIQTELAKREINKKAVTVITQVEVNKNDTAFLKPTKPIGGYYTEEQIKKIKENNPSFTYVEDSGRGYRKTVASPEPDFILEKDSILTLIREGFVVIACGGGGIPVIKTDEGGYKGIDAVIDKDFASGVLADLIDADCLIMLTAVDGVYLNFNKENQMKIEKMSPQEAQNYCDEGHFAPGSMLPKVQAAIKFINKKKGRKALICSLGNAGLAIKGKSGTVIE